MPLSFRIHPSAAPEAAPLVERRVFADVPPGGLVFGRGSRSDIVLPYPAVSLEHARIVRAGPYWAVLDLDSANGTTLDGKRLNPGVAHRMEAGQTLRLADVGVTFEGERTGAAEESPSGENTTTLARRLISDLFRASPSTETARIELLSASGAPLRGLDLEVPGHDYKVGRSPDCDLTLDDESISREHAIFVRRWDGVYVEDRNSRNGVFLDDRRLQGPCRLRDGQNVWIGALCLRVADPEDRYLRQIQAGDLPGDQAAAGTSGTTASSAPTVGKGSDSKGRQERKDPQAGKGVGAQTTADLPRQSGRQSVPRASSLATRARSSGSHPSGEIRRSGSLGAGPKLTSTALTVTGGFALTVAVLLGLWLFLAN